MWSKVIVGDPDFCVFWQGGDLFVELHEMLMDGGRFVVFDENQQQHPFSVLEFFQITFDEVFHQLLVFIPIDDTIVLRG